MYEDLIKALRRNMVETGSLICLGCGREHNCGTQGCAIMRNAAAALEAIRREPAITGETSDGYHTFNELYHHRAVLFSVICNSRQSMAWKSRLHNDGTMYDGMFIVGIDTPDGQATYHYDIDPYWEMFCVPELTKAPEWDGHTPTQAVERIGRLSAEPTNGDRIRVMPDEELAVTLMCPNEMGMADIPCDHSDDESCCQCLLDWLRQPAEGGAR